MFNGKVNICTIKELQVTLEISMYQHCCQLLFCNDVFGKVGYYMEKYYTQGGRHLTNTGPAGIQVKRIES